MTETPSEEPEQEGPRPPEPDPASLEPATTAAPAGGSRRAAAWLGALLLLVVAGVALSPFWAPALAPLLPWGAKPAPEPDLAELAERLQAVEKRPAPSVPDIGPLASAESSLSRRVDQLEAARNADRQNDVNVAATKTKLQQLEQRLGAIEAQATSRAAAEDAELQKVQQEVARLGTTVADLADRLPALERELRAQGDAERADAALLVALLQMREAVEQARPFPAEFAAFTALAHEQPELLAAAEPLAEAARDGVPGRLALSTRLSELAGRIATAPPPAPAADWGAQALTRLRALVTIRRVEGTAQSGPEAAVSAAQRALARGDLGEAVAELDRLTGANAEAAAPWLRMARQRLAVETALAHLEELLTARLTHAPEVPAKPRAPS